MVSFFKNWIGPSSQPSTDGRIIAVTSIRVLKLIFGSNGARVGVLATWEMTVERRCCAEGATVEMAAVG